jgi:carbonic anhydrase/acetyltransferase-like protein (isoleucine patch superfamily)
MRLEELSTSDTPAIHPTAYVAPSADVIGDVRLGEHASVWYGCVLRGDIAPIHVGRETNIQDLTVVHVDPDRPTMIGERVGIGHRAIIHGCEIQDGIGHRAIIHGCEIQDDSLIGMGAIVLSHAVIGSGSVVAAGALVTEGIIVPPNSLVVGLPGKVVREVDEELRGRIAHTVADYKAIKEGHRGGRWLPSERPEDRFLR